MIWRQLIWFDDCQWDQFLLRLAGTVMPNFPPTAVKKWAWPDTNGLAGASATLQHHLSHPYEGYSMVWRQLIWFDDCQWDQFLLSFADTVPFFQPTAVQKWA
jgi:hypothetical protein